MRSQFDLKQPRRLFVALVLFCYFWVSAVIPFQHTDCIGAEALPRGPLLSSTLQVASPLHTHLEAQKTAPHAGHCAACEWQSVHVSPALAAVHFTFDIPSAPRVITTFPRYLPWRAISSSSRAPPLA